MVIDFDVLREVLQTTFEVMVLQEHGAAGVEALKELLRIVADLHRNIDVVGVGASVTVVQPTSEIPNDILSALGTCERVASWTTATLHISGPAVLVIRVAGEFEVYAGDKSAFVEQLSAHAVIYRYANGTEHVIARAKSRPVPRLVQGCTSQFAVPTFADLKSALDHYKVRFASHSQCRILAAIWADERRLFLKPAPEHIMRDSLVQFLAGVLRDAEVRPEQNTDETKPVDIKVTWSEARRISLIEIKWLGKSLKADGTMGDNYSDARARVGAAQLADYLERNRPFVPSHATRGVLVLYDARRWQLSLTNQNITREHARYYGERAINYDPKYEERRQDFDPPVRFFLEPLVA